MEKKNMNIIRRSTPDSEALASSDDDHEHMKSSTHSAPGVTLPKPARRGSWLSEVQPNQQRKFSLGGSLTSPNSQPTTPSGEHGPWPGAPRAANAGSNFPWNSQQWNKEPPSRLTEVIQSATSPLHEEPLGSPSLRDQGSNSSAFPFPIPLQPLRKAVRSQSYSVGQLEDDQDPSSPHSATMFPGRTRGGAPSSLVRRTSRPSVLGESVRDNSSLGLVLEDEDDPQYLTEQGQGVKLPSSQGHITDAAAEANYMNLRQAAHENAIKQQRASVAGHVPSSTAYPTAFDGSRPSAGIDSEYAVDEPEDFAEFKAQMARNLGAGRGQWQSSLGFGSIEEVPQSRRHSFADAPLRRTRTTELPNSTGDATRNVPRFQDITEHMLKIAARQEIAERERAALKEAQYAHERRVWKHDRQVEYENKYPPRGSNPAMLLVNRAQAIAPATQENPFVVPNMNLIQRPTRTLYVVSFKCSRAEIYYIPANTGLQVKKGDMVIVEGDRGIDLGTVSAAGVGMEEAKALKEKAAEEHYRWLMMFSRHAVAVRNGLVSSSPEQTASPSSAVGGMGPPLALVPPGQVQAESTDFRPKMIKRLAQAHEIQMLRDKEGSEAKAKRVCQGKVSEHGLVMEILDAEFQLDWKKLTFFYYAEAYINFNDLVTDLFKIYKTRIWMSAINPASFAAPSTIPPSLPPYMLASFQTLDSASPESASSGSMAGSTHTLNDPSFRSIAPSLHDPRSPFVPQSYQPVHSHGPFPSQWGAPGYMAPTARSNVNYTSMAAHSPSHYPVMAPVSPMSPNALSQFGARDGSTNNGDNHIPLMTQAEADVMFRTFPSLSLGLRRPA